MHQSQPAKHDEINGGGRNIPGPPPQGHEIMTSLMNELFLFYFCYSWEPLQASKSFPVPLSLLRQPNLKLWWQSVLSDFRAANRCTLVDSMRCYDGARSSSTQSFGFQVSNLPPKMIAIGGRRVGGGKSSDVRWCQLCWFASSESTIVLNYPVSHLPYHNRPEGLPLSPSGLLSLRDYSRGTHL
jgi:hypothetical protein